MSTGKRQKTAGRKAGTPNKATAAVKEAILNAFTKVGGEDYLVTVARDDPRTFCTLLGKVLPSEVKADIEGGAPTLIKIVTPSDE